MAANKDIFKEIFEEKLQAFVKSKNDDLNKHDGFNGGGYLKIRLYSAEIIKEFSNEVLFPALGISVDPINKETIK